MHLLLRYTQALITQMAQTAVCNRHHSVDQQLCRWLLLSLDRLASNELTMTQELIANMLGVRREGVTEAAGKLQDAGLIQYRRGRITVLDRPGLEARACECYAVVKTEFDRLLPYVAQVAPAAPRPRHAVAAPRRGRYVRQRADRRDSGAVCLHRRAALARAAPASPASDIGIAHSVLRMPAGGPRPTSEESMPCHRPNGPPQPIACSRRCRAATGADCWPAARVVDLAFADVLYTSPARRSATSISPRSGFISLIMPVDASASLEVGLVGDEGMFGIPLALGVDESRRCAPSFRVRASRCGWAPRAFRRELARSPALHRAIDRYVVRPPDASSRRPRPARASTWSRRVLPAGC